MEELFSGVAVTALVFFAGRPRPGRHGVDPEVTLPGIRITLDGREVDPKDANGRQWSPSPWTAPPISPSGRWRTPWAWR